VTLSPCGCIVDIARSCYTTTMRFNPKSSVETPVIWYRAPEGARCLPFPTAFGNQFFYTIEEDQDSPIGETYDNRTWSNGKPLLGALGKKWCGTPSQFLHGLDSQPTDPPIVRDAGGLSKCCRPKCFPPGLAVFSASGIWTAPAGVFSVLVECTGGGGWGGGFSLYTTASREGGAGGGGGYAAAILNVVPGQDYIVTFTQPPAADPNLYDGWNVDFSGLISATGGKTNSQYSYLPNPGNPAGGAGGTGSRYAPVSYTGGRGGNSIGDSSWLLTPAALNGGGGGGAASAAGDGTDGQDAYAGQTSQALGGTMNGGSGGVADPTIPLIILCANVAGGVGAGAQAGIFGLLNQEVVIVGGPGEVRISWPPRCDPS